MLRNRSLLPQVSETGSERVETYGSTDRKTFLPTGFLCSASPRVTRRFSFAKNTLKTGSQLLGRAHKLGRCPTGVQYEQKMPPPTTGMMIAAPPSEWRRRFANLNPTKLADILENTGGSYFARPSYRETCVPPEKPGRPGANQCKNDLLMYVSPLGFLQNEKTT